MGGFRILDFSESATCGFYEVKLFRGIWRLDFVGVWGFRGIKKLGFGYCFLENLLLNTKKQYLVSLERDFDAELRYMLLSMLNILRMVFMRTNLFEIIKFCLLRKVCW